MKNILLLFAALFASISAYAQTVTGTVTSAADNEPLIGATVVVKGTAKGVSTDIDGNYAIQAEVGQTLVVSYVGMNTTEQKITSTVMNIALSENSNVLDEVVVVGYGAVKKSDLTSSISTVKGDEITEMTTGNAMDALQGKVNGVQIASGGGPGSQPKVLIRGVTTVNGSSPLYVVDGMPVGTSINFLNPSDIESMEVLKDASAAAIYGTRGSNGVILITTKKGRDGKINVDFSASVGFQTLKDPKMAGAEEYEKVFNARYTNDGRAVPWRSPKTGYTDAEGTDWWNTVINKTALVQNYQLGINGGNEKYTFAASVGYFRNNSQYDVGYWDKLTINLNTEFNFSKYVQAGLQIAPRTESWEDTPNQFGSAMGMDPTTPVFKHPDNWTDNPYNRYMRSYNNQVWNPAASLDRPVGHSRNYGVLLNPYLQIKPVEGLVLRTQFGVNASVVRTDSYAPIFSLDALEQSTTSSVTRRMYENVDWNWTNTANYSISIAEKHNINAMVGFTAERFGYWNVEARREGIPNDEETLREVNAGTGEQYGYGDTSYYTLVSWLGRVMYNFNQRYYITASVRVDGSSRFGDGNKYATFPAVSGAWRISEEPFMKDVDIIDNLKIRAGWGKVGNQAIANSAYQSLVGSNNVVIGGIRVPGTTMTSIGNPDLKWEKAREFNVGIDFGFFDDRLSGSIDVYTKKTSDMLFDYAVPSPPNLFPYTTANVGEMRNNGVEVMIKAIPVQTRDFRWATTFTLQHNANKLLSLSNDLYQTENVLWQVGTGDPVTQWTHKVEVGKPLGEIWTLKAVGVSEATGLWLIENPENGMAAEFYQDMRSDEDWYQRVGNGIPKVTIGWGNQFFYKDFDLSMQCMGQFGFKIVNQQRVFFENNNTMYNRLRSASDVIGGIRSLSPQQAAMVNSYYIENGDYFKMSNLTLGYTYKFKNTRWMQSVRGYFSVDNVFTITKYKGIDPELGTGNIWTPGIDDRDKYPTTRSYTIGVNLTF